jgi:hypothetical protein
LKKKSRHKKRTRRDSPKFALYIFWISWTWVLLFAVGELLEAGRNGNYGARIILCTVTLLALGCGGFALESALNQVAVAKVRRSRVDERGAINPRRRKKATAKLVDEPLAQEAKAPVDNAEVKPVEQEKRRRLKGQRKNISAE